MAGRNRKNCAEYFSHDADASSDEKIIYLESKFGHMGYAVYFKFLERMTRADNFELEWNDIKKAVYASEFNISVTEIEQIVSECCRQEIKAFRIEDGKLFSIGLRKRMQPLLDKREYNRKKYEEKKAKQSKGLNKSATEKGNSADKKTQSKGKESKGKNIYSCPEPQNGSTPESVMKIPLIPKEGFFFITQPDIDQWQQTFPGIDVKYHLGVIRQWNIDNPQRRKTKTGIRRHISSWLAKEQNRAPKNITPLPTQSTPFQTPEDRNAEIQEKLS